MKSLRYMLLAVLCLMLFGLAGCSRGTCYECRQEATLSKYVIRGTMGNAGDKGKSVHLCEDCMRMYKLFGY